LLPSNGYQNLFHPLAAVKLLDQVLNPAHLAAVGDPAYLVTFLDYPDRVNLLPVLLRP
jgi:hypothetical protein